MENGNAPVSAIELNGFGQYAPSAYLGLTKREHIAIEIMKAMISNQEVTKVEDAHDDHSIGIFCDRANLIADALIESWEK